MTALFNEAITSRETVMSHLERQDVMINDLSNSLGSASGFSTSLQKASSSLLDTETKMAKHNKVRERERGEREGERERERDRERERERERGKEGGRGDMQSGFLCYALN